MLDKEFAQRWVEALRSGQYTQGRGALRRIPGPGEESEYCCLGVACDLAVQDGLAQWEGENVFSVVVDDTQHRADRQAGVVPKALEKKLGVPHYEADGSFGLRDEDGSPIDWNDARDLDFATIADKIERLVLA